MSGDCVPTTHVLVVSDESPLSHALEVDLTMAGFAVESTADAETAMERIAVGPIDLVVLDLELLDINRTEVLQRLRSLSDVPAIVLSEHVLTSEKISLLRRGADDHVERPYSVEEMTARIHALVRRANRDPDDAPVQHFGHLEIDLARALVTLNGTRMLLTRTEYRLLETLAAAPRKLLTHQTLLRTVWGEGYGRETEYLRTFIAQLRRKLGDNAKNPQWIETVPRIGYRWLAEPDPPPPT